MRVAYVAGPYSAPDSWCREQNVRKAEEVAHGLMTWGQSDDPVAVICVHAMARFWYGNVSEQEAMAADGELLRRSDFVVLVEGWQWSKGTQAEIRLAAELGKPIFESIDTYVADMPAALDYLVSRFDELEEVPF